MPEQDKYLFKNNEHFELVLKALNAGVYEYYFEDENCWWSSKFYELLGYKRGDIPSSRQTLIDDLVHPENRTELVTTFEACQSGPHSFTLEIRLKHRSNEYRWYQFSGQTKWEDNRAIYMVGSLRDIDARIIEQQERQQHEFFLEEVGKMARVGGWEINFEPFNATMSREMALIHDLDPENIPEFTAVIDMVKSEYREMTDQAINSAKERGIPYDIEIKIITAKGRELWVRIIGKPIFNDQHKITGLRGILQDIDEQKRALLEIKKNEELLEATGQMAKIGGWEVDFKTMKGTWSKQVTLIHEMPLGFQPKLDEAIQFVHPDYIPRIQEAMGRLLTEGIPFDDELKIITGKKRELWVRAMGIPVYDPQTGEVIAAQGVFQDIDEQKHREQALQASLHLIDDQNKRLLNFTHIVSHNLRSHSTNLELTLSLMEMEKDPSELANFIQNLAKISQSLKETLESLNKVMSIQADHDSLRVPVKFETVLNNVLAALKTEIELYHVDISSDFSACEEIVYIPAYLESIFLNLVSNAIKYRRADVAPVIHIHTAKTENGPVLVVKDNGQGIDLEKYGNKLFGMYKTFHHHPDAKGIGLFMTRNQIESLGGTISVQSRVNEGCIFTVNF